MRIWLSFLVLFWLVSLSCTASERPASLEPAEQAWSQFLQDLGFLPQSSQVQAEQLRRASFEFAETRAKIQFRGAETDLANLNRAINSNSLYSWGIKQIPTYNEFDRLRQALQRERQLAELPIPNLDEISSLRLGQQHPQVSVLRHWLAFQSGQVLPQHLAQREVWDPPLIHSLKDFQLQSGLKPTGKLDAATTKLIMRPKAEKIELIQFTLRQWLQLPNDLPEQAIIVNLPQFQLDYYRKQQLQLSLPVIVGKPSTPTPLMNTKFKSVTINPSWTPPQSIIRTELLPEHRKDPYSLQRKGFELISYKQGQQALDWNLVREQSLNSWFPTHLLRQKPGNNNALGFLKLNLTQSNAIFLHDTPNKRLFREDFRALSHGCVRVKNIDILTKSLIDKRDYKNIVSNKNSIQTSSKVLPKTTFVYLVYLLARVDQHGKLSFNRDLYSLQESK